MTERLTDQSTTTRPLTIAHPWCGPDCDVRIENGYVHGRHFEAQPAMETHYGADLYVGLTAEPYPSGALGDDHSIALRVSSPKVAGGRQRWTFAGDAHLTDDEALELAQRLTAAVERNRACQR